MPFEELMKEGSQMTKDWKSRTCVTCASVQNDLITGEMLECKNVTARNVVKLMCHLGN